MSMRAFKQSIPSLHVPYCRRGVIHHALLPSIFASFVLILLMIICLPAVAHAATKGSISGRLLDGTKHNAPVVGQSVTLQMAQGNNAHDVTSVKTDAQGSFTFNNLATDKATSYAIYTRYQGAQYYTSLINLNAKPLQQVNLTVYEATTSTAKVAVVQATVLVHKPQNGLISISEIFYFKNLGKNTYVGSLDTSKGKPNALLFALPKGARNVSLSTGFDGYQAIQVDQGFATDAALPPGDSQFAFSFEVPYTTSNYDFNYNVIYPTVQLSLLVPAEFNVSSGALTAGGVITADQHPYRLFQAKDLLAGAELHAQLQGLPVTAAPAGPLNAGMIWLIVGVLVMLAIIAVTWFAYRSYRRPARRQEGRQPAGRQDGKRTLVKTTEAEGEEDSRQQALLQEVLKLDKAYEAGKLRKAVYQERRAKVKAQLRTLMAGEEVKTGAKGATKKAARSSGKEAL